MAAINIKPAAQKLSHAEVRFLFHSPMPCSSISKPTKGTAIFTASGYVPFSCITTAAAMAMETTIRAIKITVFNMNLHAGQGIAPAE